MSNEIIKQAIMRFAFEAEKLREVINYRETYSFGVLNLDDNFFCFCCWEQGVFVHRKVKSIS